MKLHPAKYARKYACQLAKILKKYAFLQFLRFFLPDNRKSATKLAYLSDKTASMAAKMQVFTLPASVLNYLMQLVFPYTNVEFGNLAFLR